MTKPNSAQTAYEDFLAKAGYKDIKRRTGLLKKKEYCVEGVNGGGTTYHLEGHFVNFDEAGNHNTTFTFR